MSNSLNNNPTIGNRFGVVVDDQNACQIMKSIRIEIGNNMVVG